MKRDTETNGDQAFIDSLTRELDDSCRRLDGHTLSRLNSIRHAALDRPRASRNKVLLAPFGGLVTAAVLVALVSLYYPNQPVNTPADTGTVLEDLEILTSADSIEFYEDLEFYMWLAENDSSV